MRAVIQRVKSATVRVNGAVVGEIGAGLLVLLAVAAGDTRDQAAWMSRKLSRLRIFPDDEGKMNRSLLDVGGEVLVVSQFTLYGDCRKGNRPSFMRSAAPKLAEPLYELFCEMMTKAGCASVERGVFGAMMDVGLINDGPVTLVVDSP